MRYPLIHTILSYININILDISHIYSRVNNKKDNLNNL